MDLKTKQRIAVSAVFFQSGLCFSTWAIRIPTIKATFHLSETELGSLLLIKPAGALVGLPLAGWLVDKFGSKSATIIAACTYSIFLTTIGLAPSVLWLCLALLMFGISGNLFNIANNVQALNMQNAYGKVIMASFHGLWSLGGFFGGALGSFLLSLKVDIIPHMLIVSFFVLFLLFLSHRFLLNESAAKASGKPAFQLPDAALLKLGLIAFCGMMCEGCMFDWSGVYFKEVVGANKGLVGAGYIAFMSTMASVRFISDFFTNKFGSKTILIASGLLIFIGLITSVLFPYLVTAIIGFFLVGAGTASVIPLTYSEVGKTTKFSPGIALSIASTIGYFGFLFGPPIIGFVAGAVNLRASFTLIAAVGITISILTGLSVLKARKSVA